MTVIIEVYNYIGVSIQFVDRNEPVNIKPFVICFTADLPARAAVQNVVQFNGFYGCSFCEQPGVTVHTSLRGHVHAFPFIPGDPNGPHMQRARQSYQTS